jgi:hypothetical protein
MQWRNKLVPQDGFEPSTYRRLPAYFLSGQVKQCILGQDLFCPRAHVGRAESIHLPAIRLPVRDQCSDADDGVVCSQAVLTARILRSPFR